MYIYISTASTTKATTTTRCQSKEENRRAAKLEPWPRTNQLVQPHRQLRRVSWSGIHCLPCCLLEHLNA